MNTLVQHDDRNNKLLDLCRKLHQPYCDRWHWNYVTSTEAIPGWARFVLLAREMERMGEGQCLVWLDSDSLIVRPDVDLSEAVAGYDAAITTMAGMLHAGAIYLRNTPAARGFIDRCAAHSANKPSQAAPFWLEEMVGNARVHRLNPSWDQWYGADGNCDEPAVVRSFHTKSIAEKTQSMKGLVK